MAELIQRYRLMPLLFNFNLFLHLGFITFNFAPNQTSLLLIEG